MAPAAAGGHINLSLESSSSSATGRTQEFATTTTHAAAAGTNHYSSTDRRRRNSYMVNSEAAAASSSSRAAGGSGTSEQQGGNLHESPKRDGSRVAEEEEETQSSIGPAQKLCIGGGKKRLSPYRRVSDVREARRASLDNNSSHKFAYVSSLEGRLFTNSVQMATESGGGGLPPEKETQQSAAASKKKEMDPLERVLIVAVSAAAAAAGKYQKTEEFCRLRNAVDAREKELESMRQKLSNLCKQESGGNREFDLTLGDSALTLVEREQEQQQQQQCKNNNNNNRLSTQESSAAKEVAMEVDGSACRAEEEEAAAAVVSDDSEAKWYCNPMLQTGEHYFEMCTPEYDDPLFPIFQHDKKEEQDNLQEQRQWQQQQWKESKNGSLQRNLQKTAAGPQDGAAVETRKHQFAHHTNKKQSKFRIAAESDSSSAEVVAEQLLEELERAAGKVADMENQIKSLKQYAAESDANWKDSEVKLEEWIEGDYENQTKAHMEMQHLRRQLCTQESEYKSLERSCKVMLAVKSKEITELREDCQRRDAALDDITAAARATRAASDERIGVLEDLCRRKDSVIFDLKQDILALESKINGMRTFQAPAILHHAARSHSCMCLPPPHQSDELIVANMSLPETNTTTRRFPYYLPPVQSAAQGQQSSFSVEPQKDCLSEGNDCRGGACSSSSMLQLCEDYTSVDKPLHATAYRIDQESAKDFYSPTPSTIGDDFHELESSLLALSIDEERKTRGSTSSGRSRNLPTPPPLENYHVVEESDFNHNLPRQQKKSPVTKSTSTSTTGRMQVNAAASTTVNNESMRTSSSSSNIAAGKLTSYSGKKKVAVKRESFCSPRTSVEILGPVRTNTCYDPRRAMSVDLTNGGFKSLARNGLKENSIKQRRWV